MAKYIDADIAEKSLRQYAEQKYANGEIELANGILKAVCKLKTLPAADVKEVQMGHKVVAMRKHIEHIASDWMCSECGARIFDDDVYCPLCGTNVREVE